MGKLIGYDGKEYDNPLEWSKANERWEREEAQKKSLERQEELIEKQNELIEEQAVEQRRIAEEQMENDRWIEIERQEHEKEKRLFSLCDKIGISKKIMDNFIEYIRSSTDDTLKTEEGKKIDDKFDNIIHEIYKIYIQLVEQYNSEILGNASLGIVHDFSVINEILKISAFISLLLILLDYLFIPFIPIGYVTLGVTILVYFSLAIYNFIQKDKREEYFSLKKECIKFNSDITDVNDIFVYLIQFEKTFPNLIDDEEKNNKVLSNLRKNRADYLKRLREMSSNEINNRLKHFYQFRLSHYNSQFEKFLVDYDFDNKIKMGNDALNINYKVVTKSLAKGKGDIEDYIEYFNKL